jgi:Zn-dependent protease with chaperone function
VDAGTFVPLLLPLLSWPLARLMAVRAWPRLASWLLAVTALALATGSTIVLALLAVSGLSSVPKVAEVGEVGEWSPAVMRGMSMASGPVELACGVLLAAMVARLVIAGVRCVRWTWMVRSAAVRSSTELVVVDGDPVAVAVPFGGGRIVVARTLLAELEPAEVRSLLAHERAHLRRRHHWFLVVVGAALALNPLVLPLRAALEFALERWADEDAVADVGDRKVVATAVAKAALAVKGSTRIGLAATGGPVPRRVAALLAGPVPRRWGVVVGVTAALAVATWSAQATVEAAGDLHAGIELASVDDHQADDHQ